MFPFECVNLVAKYFWEVWLLFEGNSPFSHFDGIPSQWVARPSTRDSFQWFRQKWYLNVDIRRCFCWFWTCPWHFQAYIYMYTLGCHPPHRTSIHQKSCDRHHQDDGLQHLGDQESHLLNYHLLQDGVTCIPSYNYFTTLAKIKTYQNIHQNITNLRKPRYDWNLPTPPNEFGTLSFLILIILFRCLTLGKPPQFTRFTRRKNISEPWRLCSTAEGDGPPWALTTANHRSRGGGGRDFRRYFLIKWYEMRS